MLYKLSESIAFYEDFKLYEIEIDKQILWAKVVMCFAFMGFIIFADWFLKSRTKKTIKVVSGQKINTNNGHIHKRRASKSDKLE